MPATDDFHQAVARVEMAITQFITGNPEPLKAVWSHADDATIFGGLGAYARGWEQVRSSVDRASAGFRGGYVNFEPLAWGVSGDLAYTVCLEKGVVSLTGREGLSPLALRVTHIYRREEGAWKLIHRHGDAITQEIEPTAVSQQ
jgi:ketosteroid isomerase-like protein